MDVEVFAKQNKPRSFLTNGWNSPSHIPTTIHFLFMDSIQYHKGLACDCSIQWNESQTLQCTDAVFHFFLVSPLTNCLSLFSVAWSPYLRSGGTWIGQSTGILRNNYVYVVKHVHNIFLKKSRVLPHNGVHVWMIMTDHGWAYYDGKAVLLVYTNVVHTPGQSGKYTHSIVTTIRSELKPQFEIVFIGTLKFRSATLWCFI